MDAIIREEGDGHKWASLFLKTCYREDYCFPGTHMPHAHTAHTHTHTIKDEIFRMVKSFMT